MMGRQLGALAAALLCGCGGMAGIDPFGAAGAGGTAGGGVTAGGAGQSSTSTEGGGGSTTTTTTAGGAGAGAGPVKECESNTDCAAPKPICDTIKGKCFECTEPIHCAEKPGTTCSMGSCLCPVAGQTWCGPNDCVDLQTAPKSCGSCGHECFGACKNGKCADAWEPLPKQGAPSPRARHVAVWTGKQMIVWGGATGPGFDNNTNTGAIYDPDTFQWSEMSTVGAPSPRQGATAVWNNNIGPHSMIVWGGRDASGALGTGGAYDPASNTWTATTTDGAPSPRYNHTAVWAGPKMVVWGGFDGKQQLFTGAMYDMGNDLWVPVKDPPVISRELHSAVYADGKMYVFGGRGDVPGGPSDAYFPDPGYVIATSGVQFDVLLNTWGKLPYANQPAARAGHSAVWTGKPWNEMMIWGGYDGAKYLAAGAVFVPMLLAWKTMNDPQPEPRWRHTAIWIDAGNVMIVWGGYCEGKGALGSGGIFDPASSSWVASTPVAPAARYDHSAVSTGKRMIVWGGEDAGKLFGDGAVFSP
ncbi:MAG: hypothetical protein HY744_19755 [Deltaproteobacteria bacterium]|nr:hypothetical protein [Deltaproteobacteria bacterium]